MNLKMETTIFRQILNGIDDFRIGGEVQNCREVINANLPAAVGDVCRIHMRTPGSMRSSSDQESGVLLGEVISSTASESQIMTFRHPRGIRPGLRVMSTGSGLRIPTGNSVLGRTLNGLGEPIDDGPALTNCRHRTIQNSTPKALDRRPITRPFVTGQRAIDGLLTLGIGQRVGLFAGSGVGKSTLMGEIAKHAEADLNVIVLVGERGREVRPFIEECLGAQGLRRSVVIVATSDETPLMRIQAVRSAVQIAADFREQGANVLFFLDSITRLAHAQRELGLARGEPPGTRGYPPSVNNLLASTLEHLGNDERGSITGIITVLVDGDDLDEPISDAARSILDGHLVLDRKLAARGHFPALNILNSVSRLFRDVTSSEHQVVAGRVREHLAAYEETKDLIQVGLYQQGTIPEIDAAIAKMPRVLEFVTQQYGEHSSWASTMQALNALANT